MGTTFVLVLFGWILFRAESLTHALDYLNRICSPSLFEPFRIPGFPFPPTITRGVAITCGFILLMFLLEWIHRHRPHPLCFRTPHRLLPHALYIALLLVIYLFNAANPAPFIYFQF